MKLELLHDADLHRNRLLRAAGQLLSAAPSDPVLGEFLFAASNAPNGPLRWQVYDGVAGQGSPSVGWSIHAGLNRDETVTGFWTWSALVRGAGTADGQKAPFGIGAASQFDAAGRLRNWVQHLNSDYLDGFGAVQPGSGTVAPSSDTIPVYYGTSGTGGSGRLVVGDPSEDYDAVNKKTWQAGLTGMVVLAPVKVASTTRFAGVRSNNVITASSPGALVIDGISMAVNDRLLLKDQGSGGTAIDNGVFVVTNAGAAGVNAILTRSADADQTGELTIGALVYVEQGTANRATQWSCQHAAGETGASIIINTQQQIWVKTFQQSAYTEGRGIKFNGLEINFSQNADYPIGALFTATAARTVLPLALPTGGVKRWLSHPASADTQPAWSAIVLADIGDTSGLVTVGSRTSKIHTRWTTTPSATQNQIENSLMEDTTDACVGVGNGLVTATIQLGASDKPWANTWTNILRLKPTAGTGIRLTSLLGFMDSTGDPNGQHKQAVTFAAADVKTWLSLSAGDVSAVPTTRTLEIKGTTGQVSVSAPNLQDLTADRSWTVSLDFTALDTRWMTLHSAQNASGQKSFYSATSSAAEVLLRMSVSGNPLPATVSEPTWVVTAGGAVKWGDGVAAATATIDFNTDKLRVSGKGFWIATTAPFYIDSALASSGAPASILGLTPTTNQVRKVSSDDLWTFLGQPVLAPGAVGFGDAGGHLKGDATTFKWDESNKRLGLNQGTPAVTLDMVGGGLLTTTVTSVAAAGTLATYPGWRSVITDTATASADWTSRTLIGQSVSVTKSGAANFVTAATIDGLRTAVAVDGGSVANLIGHRVQISVGNAGAGATAATVTGFFCVLSGAAGANGSITNLTQFLAQDLAAPYPQPLNHYGFRCPNLTSGPGASLTVGFQSELNSSGTPTRYAFHASGSANNYFVGPLGLGANDPTGARLYLGVGTTTICPIRFSPNSDNGVVTPPATLLTSPVSGAFESNGDRLWFTTLAPLRRGLAFVDEPNFTNDAGADQGGSVALGPGDYVLSRLWNGTTDTELIGTSDVTLFARFLVPTVMRGPTRDWIMAIHDVGALNGYVNAFHVGINGINLEIGATPSTSAFRRCYVLNFITKYGGKVVDLVLVRSGPGQPVVYVNGIQETTSADSTGGAAPANWAHSVVSKYCSVGTVHTGNGSVQRIHRAALFNRALTAAEARDLGLYGVSDTDQWGSQTPVHTANFTASADGWFGADGATNNPVTFNQTVDGSGGWLTVTRANGAGRCELAKSMTGYRAQSRWRLAGTLFRSTGEPPFMGGSQAGTGSTAPVKAALPSGTSTNISLDLLARNISTTTIQPRWEPGTAANTTTNVSIAAGSAYSLKNVTLSLLGAVLDLNLGIGCGSGAPDRSGRYHGVITGTNWYHYTSKCPTPLPSGPGTITYGLRRYVQTITAKDMDVIPVTHNLGTTDILVQVWDQVGQRVVVAVQRKLGSETTVVELGFALLGSATPVPFLVVIIG